MLQQERIMARCRVSTINPKCLTQPLMTLLLAFVKTLTARFIGTFDRRGRIMNRILLSDGTE